MPRHLVKLALLCAALGACASPAPLSLSLSKGDPIRGSEPAMAYSSTLSGEQKHECRASYSGGSESSTVLLEVRCLNAGYGIGTGEIRNSRLIGGVVRMQRDGREARVLVNGG